MMRYGLSPSQKVVLGHEIPRFTRTDFMFGVSFQLSCGLQKLQRLLLVVDCSSGMPLLSSACPPR